MRNLPRQRLAGLYPRYLPTVQLADANQGLELRRGRLDLVMAGPTPDDQTDPAAAPPLSVIGGPGADFTWCSAGSSAHRGSRPIAGASPKRGRRDGGRSRRMILQLGEHCLEGEDPRR
jgi:hypothetical protein